MLEQWSVWPGQWGKTQSPPVATPISRDSEFLMNEGGNAMFLVAYFYISEGNRTHFFTYGPFPDQATAQAWINALPFPTNYTVIPVYALPPAPVRTPGQVATGNLVVVLASGTPTVPVAAWGPFTTQQAAEDWILSRPAGVQPALYVKSVRSAN